MGSLSLLAMDFREVVVPKRRFDEAFSELSSYALENMNLGRLKAALYLKVVPEYFRSTKGTIGAYLEFCRGMPAAKLEEIGRKLSLDRNHYIGKFIELNGAQKNAIVSADSRIIIQPTIDAYKDEGIYTDLVSNDTKIGPDGRLTGELVPYSSIPELNTGVITNGIEKLRALAAVFRHYKIDPRKTPKKVRYVGDYAEHEAEIRKALPDCWLDTESIKRIVQSAGEFRSRLSSRKADKRANTIKRKRFGGTIE